MARQARGVPIERFFEARQMRLSERQTQQSAKTGTRNNKYGQETRRALFLVKIHLAKIRASNARCVLQHLLENRLQLAMRAADDPKNL